MSTVVNLSSASTNPHIVAADVYSMDVEVIAPGGGARNGGTPSGRPGAGGGAYSKKTIAVTPGQSIPFSAPVGATHGASGNTGSDAWFVANDATGIVAKGGGAPGIGTGGAGGLASGGFGTFKQSGGAGAANVTTTGGGGGAAGDLSGDGAAGSGGTGGTGVGVGGSGGNGGTAGVAGSTGATPGGGGGGGGSAGAAGGDGGPARIILTFDALADHLVVTTQPAGVETCNTTFTQAALGGSPMIDVVVEARDSGNVLDSGFSEDVTVEITAGTGPAGAVLGGTLTQTASGGVASFSDLVIDLPGYNYSLTFRSTGFAGPVTTNTFHVGSLALAPGLNLRRGAIGF